MTTRMKKTSKAQLLHYLINAVKAPVSRRRYFLLSPPWVCSNKIFDKKSRELIRLESRGAADYGTIVQVYLDQEYDLTGISRSIALKEEFHAIKSGSERPLILDCGANIGAASTYLAMHWPETVIWALEPSLQNCAIAEKNLPDGSRLIHGAIGSVDGAGAIENPSASPNAFRVRSGDSMEGAEIVKIVSMPTLLTEAARAGLKPFILKVDIEGAEEAMFADGKSWLADWPVLLIELHDWMLPGSAVSRNVLRAISQTNRDVIIKNNTLISLRNA